MPLIDKLSIKKNSFLKKKRGRKISVSETSGCSLLSCGFVTTLSTGSVVMLTSELVAPITYRSGTELTFTPVSRVKLMNCKIGSWRTN